MVPKLVPYTFILMRPLPTFRELLVVPSATVVVAELLSRLLHRTVADVVTKARLQS